MEIPTVFKDLLTCWSFPALEGLSIMSTVQAVRRRKGAQEGSSLLLRARTQSHKTGMYSCVQTKFWGSSIGKGGENRLGEQLAVSAIDGLSEEVTLKVRT